ncbi:MAG TPA: hypothetical protein VJW95_01120 [Dissulfurispiraceae bacterium]|nr:hypothetical protein [Dissulfurispiraceae bacterium]
MKIPEPNMTFVFIAKEEILRNIVNTHDFILVQGWKGTGKTVTALKAVAGMGDIYYYNGSAEEIPQHTGQLNVVKNCQELRAIEPGKQCIIFDNLNRLDSEARNTLKDMVLERIKDRKILVITEVVLDAQDILGNMDVVVRFRQNTAEMLDTKLYNLNSCCRF